MRWILNRSDHVPNEAFVLILLPMFAVCSAGVLAPVHALGGEPRSDRTVSVGLQIDRAGMQIVSFTLKDRPFQGPAELAPVRPFRGAGMVQIEVQLVGNGGESFLRRLDLGPLCFEHGPASTISFSTSTIVTFTAIAINGLKLRWVRRKTRLPAVSAFQQRIRA